MLALNRANGIRPSAKPGETALGNAQVLPRDVQRHVIGVLLSQFIRFLLAYELVLLSPHATAQKLPYSGSL